MTKKQLLAEYKRQALSLLDAMDTPTLKAIDALVHDLINLDVHDGDTHIPVRDRWSLWSLANEAHDLLKARATQESTAAARQQREAAIKTLYDLMRDELAGSESYEVEIWDECEDDDDDCEDEGEGAQIVAIDIADFVDSFEVFEQWIMVAGSPITEDFLQFYARKHQVALPEYVRKLETSS